MSAVLNRHGYNQAMTNKTNWVMTDFEYLREIRRITYNIQTLLDRVTVSNKNLLPNWDFRNPVNQRGQRVYPNGGYSIDRWIIEKGTLQVIPGGIRLTANDEDGVFQQKITRQEIELLAGNALTLSLQKIDGAILSTTIYLPNIIDSEVHGYSIPVANGVWLEIYTGPDNWAYQIFRIVCLKGVTLDIACAKTEIGSISTLAYDPPANYREQLALCQRYYQRFRAQGTHDMFVQGAFSSARDFVGTIKLSTILHQVPTITSSGNIVTMAWTGADEKITSIFFVCLVNNALTFAVSIGADVPVGSMRVLRAWEDPIAYIDFDAEIY